MIVVGARCAGAPTAMLLARRGYRVLLLDRAEFPSDTLSTHAIKTPGVAHLAQWGLLDPVAASGCPPVRGFVFDTGQVALAGVPPQLPGVPGPYCPRRTVLDKILVDAAAEAGVEVRERAVVEELVWDGERVDGVRLRANGSARVVERASLVVGADGRHSVVAKEVQAPSYRENPALTCTYYAYWDAGPSECIELHPRQGRSLIALPTNDGLTCVAVQWPAAEAARFRADVEGNYLATLDLVPGLAERVRAGTRQGRFRGTADLPHFFRRPYGPGWALVGDAGCHKDPILAQGITDAFRDAGLLADAADDGLSGRRPMHEALADYQRRRDEAAVPLYDLTAQLAALEPLPRPMQQVLSALEGNQEQTDRLLGVFEGTVPVDEFFGRRNVAAILAAARRRRSDAQSVASSGSAPGAE